MMMRFAVAAALALLAACSMRGAGPGPSLASRAEEAIDPRVTIPSEVPMGSVDPVFAGRLRELVEAARSGSPAFDARRAEAERAVATAGGAQSESWIAAQQVLARLIEQQGVTTRAAADIDALAATRLSTQHWIAPANQQAIAAAATAVAAINNGQIGEIERLRSRLER